MRGLVLALCCAVAACSPRIAADISPPPDALLVACAEPQTWQRGQALSQAESEIFWGRDRTALRDCADRHALLADWARGQMGAR